MDSPLREKWDDKWENFLGIMASEALSDREEYGIDIGDLSSMFTDPEISDVSSSNLSIDTAEYIRANQKHRTQVTKKTKNSRYKTIVNKKICSGTEKETLNSQPVVKIETLPSASTSIEYPQKKRKRSRASNFSSESSAIAKKEPYSHCSAFSEMRGSMANIPKSIVIYKPDPSSTLKSKIRISNEHFGKAMKEEKNWLPAKVEEMDSTNTVKLEKMDSETEFSSDSEADPMNMNMLLLPKIERNVD